MITPAHRSGPNGSLSHVGSANLALPVAGELLHGLVLRPALLCWNGSAYTGPKLTEINTVDAGDTPGVVKVVVRKNFIGIIASQPGQALQARSRLQPGWAMPVSPAHAVSPPTDNGWQNHTAGQTANHSPKGERLSHEYGWPLQQSATAAWAIAHHTSDNLTIWTHTRHQESLRNELAQLCGLPPEAVQIIANGQTQTEGYDAAADAALLSQACGRPVRVQHSPAVEAGQTIMLEVSGSCSTDQTLRETAYEPPNAAAAPVTDIRLASDQQLVRRPSIAALLCGLQSNYAPDIVVRLLDCGLPPHYQPTATDTLILEGAVQGLPTSAQVFAQESFFDEACAQQNLDPIQARLDTIKDATGRDLISAVASRALWPESNPKQGGHDYQGKGFAYAHVIDQTQQPPREVWSAWVAEVRVNPSTGAIDLTGLTVGHNSGTTPPSTTPQIEDNVRQAATRWLQDATGFDTWAETPSTDLSLATANASVQLVEQSPAGLAWSREAELPAAAAIANAVYAATGIRLRTPPFNADEIKQQLALKNSEHRQKKTTYTLLGGVAAAIGGLLIAALPWRAAIAPVANVDTSIYSAAAIERGRLVAAAGDCMVCHTAEGGTPNAGGLKLDTPFGAIVTTNITPDKETGIGSWSYAAFERAMREGIHRDGRHLYPAFPYTAFAKITDADMQSLYAYLMTQEPVRNQVEPTALRFPYNLRPLLAGWNLLYHNNDTYQPDPAQSTLWNRGAYLVQGMGHCAACHSPRNAMGAEKSGNENFLAGGFAEGWEAPALNALSKAPLPWTEEELYHYLRTGYSPLHGVASGPMAPVIQSMAELPDQDVRAVAHYLATLAPPPSDETSPALQAALLEERSRNDQRVLSLAGENLFQGACAVCHDAREGPPLFGSRPSLALNTNLHSDHPDNAIQILLRGIDNPAAAELGYMPGFADSLNDQQLETLLEYLRMRFAPDKPAWQGLPEKIRAIREGD